MTEQLIATRLIFVKAVRDYIATNRISAIDQYSHGSPELRREVIRFALWVRKNGEPRWFQQEQCPLNLD